MRVKIRRGAHSGNELKWKKSGKKVEKERLNPKYSLELRDEY